MYPDKLISAKDFQFQPVTPELLVQNADKFYLHFKRYLNHMSSLFDSYSTDIRINYPMLYRITERIEQRRDYYLYFHSNDTYTMQMSQAKETALFCYWFVKYKPLSFNSAKEELQFFEDNSYTLNESYVAYLLTSFIVGLDVDNRKYFDDEAVATLTYSLTNREISKEALILYVESFITHKS